MFNFTVYFIIRSLLVFVNGTALAPIKCALTELPVFCHFFLISNYGYKKTSKREYVYCHIYIIISQ